MKRIFKGVKRKHLLIFMVFVLVVSILTIFGDKGLIEAYVLKSEKDVILSNIRDLKESNKALKEDVELLRNDTRYVERIARKELGMIGKGEVIYMFDE